MNTTINRLNRALNQELYLIPENKLLISIFEDNKIDVNTDEQKIINSFNKIKYALALEELFDNATSANNIEQIEKSLIEKYELNIFNNEKEFQAVSLELQKNIDNTQKIKEKLNLHEPTSKKSLEFMMQAIHADHLTHLKQKNPNNFKIWQEIVSEAIIKPFGFALGVYLPYDDLNTLFQIHKKTNTDLKIRGFVTHKDRKRYMPFFYCLQDALNDKDEDLTTSSLVLNINDYKNTIEHIKQHEYKHVIDSIIHRTTPNNKANLGMNTFYLNEVSAYAYDSNLTKQNINNDIDQFIKQYTKIRDSYQRRANTLTEIFAPESLIKKENEKVNKLNTFMNDTPKLFKEKIMDPLFTIYMNELLELKTISYVVASNNYTDLINVLDTLAKLNEKTYAANRQK